METPLEPYALRYVRQLLKLTRWQAGQRVKVSPHCWKQWETGANPITPKRRAELRAEFPELAQATPPKARALNTVQPKPLKLAKLIPPPKVRPPPLCRPLPYEIRAARQGLNWTQVQAAKLAQVPERDWWKWELGASGPTAKAWEFLRKLFAAPPATGAEPEGQAETWDHANPLEMWAAGVEARATKLELERRARAELQARCVPAAEPTKPREPPDLASMPGALPDNLRTLREGLGLNIQDAAQVCGVHPSTWSRWESGETPMPLKRWKTFSNPLTPEWKTMTETANADPDKVRLHREIAELTRDAAGAVLGVSGRTWKAWELGSRKMSAKLLADFDELCAVPTLNQIPDLPAPCSQVWTARQEEESEEDLAKPLLYTEKGFRESRQADERQQRQAQEQADERTAEDLRRTAQILTRD